MPHKGFFTQSAILLLEAVPQEQSVIEALSGWEVFRGAPPDADSAWFTGEPPLIIEWRPEVNGAFMIDWFPAVWPDGMGNTQDQQMLFGAWSLGHFGPFTFPGGLERAVQQAWHMKNADALAARHRAFLRIRSSYVFGASEEDLVMPKDYKALPELQAITEVASRLLDLPQVIAYFNPNGETLYTPSDLRDLLAGAAAESQPPMPAWVNVRFVTFAGTEWALMDTVGMQQLDLKDHEVCFPNSIEPDEVASFLRNVCLARLDYGDNIGDRHTVEIAGGRHWRAHFNEEPRLEPPRETLRWFPVAGPPPPETLVPKKPKRSLFGIKLPWQK